MFGGIEVPTSTELFFLIWEALFYSIIDHLHNHNFGSSKLFRSVTLEQIQSQSDCLPIQNICQIRVTMLLAILTKLD